MTHVMEFMEMRDVFLAAGVSGLFHLFEKQLYKHFNSELRDWLLAPITDWKSVSELIGKLQHRYGAGDAAELATNFHNPDLRELQLVANAVKHGRGHSYDALCKMGARVVSSREVDRDWTIGDLSPLAVPIAIEAADIERYREAVLRFWETEGTYWADRSAFR